MTFARVGNDLLVQIANTDDRLTIRGFFADERAAVEFFDFNDANLTAEELRASLLLGTAGDDNILGYATDDLLSGGAGNDRLDGSGGSDNYTFALGDGSDIIADSGTDGEDTIRFSANVLPADVAVTRSESDLLLVVRGTGERVIIEGWFGNAGPAIESVVFEDGTVWSPAELTAWASTPVTPSADDDFIVGSDAGDVIDALAGNDEIHALAGDDQLTGGTGNDRLSGGSGNDTYIYQQGDGSDVIAGEGRDGTDILSLGGGIDPDQVVVKRDAAHLYLQLPDGETITIENWFGDAANRLATVQFADGTAWNTDDLEALANTPTDGDDFIVGGMSDDFIDGLSGDDAIQGQEGNDILAGGTGSDRLDGGSGDDVYVFNAGDGSDRIVDADGYDSIQFGEGITPEEVQVFADPNGAIVLQRYGPDDRILISATVTNQWGDISVKPVIESFEFADGTIWTADDVAAYAMSAPTTGGDSLQGSDRPEIIDGLGGSDYVAGGLGDDRYVFKPGYGQLTINDSDGNSDALIFGDGIAPDDLTVRRDYDSLILEVTGTEDRVRVESQFSSWNTGNRIERFVFADGTEWNISDVELRLVVPEGTASYDHIYGSGRNDTINGLAGDDWLDGASGDDVLDGGTGADQIEGGDGDDTLISGASTASDLEREVNYRWGFWYNSAHDRLAGGAGDDTYVINADSGYDQITDAEGSNRIVLGQGLSAENVIISTGSGWEHSGQTQIDFGSGAVFVDAGSRIDRIESADGVVITADDFDKYRLASISGTTSADVLTGTKGPDDIYGGDGNDVIHGGAGRDSLRGGTGNDRLFGDSGDDTIEDGEGENFIDGGAGNDNLSGNGYLSGGAGDDTLSGYGILDGGAGNDLIYANSGAVVLFGEGSGNDVIKNASYAQGFVVRTDLQPSEVEIVGGKLDGLEVPLTLRIVSTGESLAGINGAASVVFADGSAWSAADIAAHTRMPEPIDTVGNDTLLGSSGDDVLAAGEGDDRLAGGAGADTLDGVNGNDTLYGGDGNDILLGGDGNDQLTGGAGDDQLFGGAGIDTLTGGGGNNVLDGGAGSDYYYGGAGIDTIRFGRGSGYDTFSGGLEGAQSPLTIVEMGADVLPEDVSVARFDSSVRFMVKDSGDSLVISYWLGQAQPASALEVRFADGTVWNTDAVLAMLPAGLGDFRDNTLTGGDNNETIEGYGGNDNISGGAGNDYLYGASGDDRLSGDAGNDHLSGGDGFDILLGGDGNDTLNGGSGADLLDGGAGNDVIYAGDGSYYSEASADTIVFGFGSGEDTLASSDSRDEIQLGDGVRMQDVDIKVSGSELQIRLAGGSDTLRISGWTYASDRVSTLRFADGSELDLRASPS
ncbi:MAG: calcium-binding protein, partial [Sulfurimicrobium sp.]|nr:calcium-binding protein [Sulfurimicrobium sp.]